MVKKTKSLHTLLLLVVYIVFMCAKSLQSCLTLGDHVNYSPPGSSVHGILQAKILGLVAIPFSRETSQPKDGTWVSHIAGRFFTVCDTREALVVCITYVIFWYPINVFKPCCLMIWTSPCAWHDVAESKHRCGQGGAFNLSLSPTTDIWGHHSAGREWLFLSPPHSSLPDLLNISPSSPTLRQSLIWPQTKGPSPFLID